MKIKIYRNTLSSSHVIYMNDKKRNYLLVDRKRRDFDLDRFKFNILDMVSDWEKEMKDPNVLDGLIYKIVISENDEEKIYSFENKFPDDIYRLEMLINEIVAEV